MIQEACVDWRYGILRYKIKQQIKSRSFIAKETKYGEYIYTNTDGSKEPLKEAGGAAVVIPIKLFKWMCSRVMCNIVCIRMGGGHNRKENAHL